MGPDGVREGGAVKQRRAACLIPFAMFESAGKSLGHVGITDVIT
jgi:hypothetical protein